MTCPHCYASAIRRDEGKAHRGARPGVVLEKLAAAGVKILILSGGEPLMRPDFGEILRQARKLGFQIFLSTNGVLLDSEEKVDELVRAGVRYVGISLDGLPAFNDTYRGLPGGFNRVKLAIHMCRAAGLKTGIRMTLSRHNHHQLRDMLDMVTEWGVERFYLSHLLYSGRAKSLKNDDLSRARRREVLEELTDFALASFEREPRGPAGPRIVTGGNDSDPAYFWLYLRRTRPEIFSTAKETWLKELLQSRGGNSAGEKILNIDHRGNVHPDQFWRGVSLGNIFRDSWEQIQNHPLRRKLRDRTQFLSGRCSGCQYLEICRGSHRERAWAVTGDIWASDPACLLNDREIADGSAAQNRELAHELQ